MVFTEATGVLTDGDILGHKSRLLADPAFDPSMPQISDIRGIERLDVTSAGVRAMVDHDTINAARRRGHRMALIVPQTAVFGMARMYELMGQGADDSVGVFRTAEEAYLWLAQFPDAAP